MYIFKNVRRETNTEHCNKQKSERCKNVFLLNAINSGVRQTDTLAAKQTKAFE